MKANIDYFTNFVVPSNITLASGVEQDQYINVNGSYKIKSNIAYGIPLSQNRHGNVKFASFLQYERNISFVNGIENINKRITYGQDIAANYNYLDKLFIEARIQLDYTGSSYSIQQGYSDLFFQTAHHRRREHDITDRTEPDDQKFHAAKLGLKFRESPRRRESHDFIPRYN